jgi:hypothetical protein
MKTTLLALLALLLAAPPVYAQGPTISPQKAAEAKQGRRMVIAGAALAIGGLAVMPITANASDQLSGAALAVPMTMIGGGAALAWFGARKARNAVRPEMSCGITAGATKGIFWRRKW